MKGVYQRAVVLAAAKRAVEHWYEAFQVRRCQWIQDTSDLVWKSRMFGSAQVVGMDLALERFERSWVAAQMSDDRIDNLPAGDGGRNWWEAIKLDQARKLVLLTDRKQPGTVVLNEGEIGCLRPVMPAATAKRAA